MSENVHDKKRLVELQALPLERKIQITQTRIIEWYTRWNGQVYVSFSGGKDSTVLLHIARQCFPDIEAVFVNTGLEFPEIQKFCKSFDNVTVLRPEMSFVEVLTTYGYPIISKEVANTISGARSSIEQRKYSIRLCKLGVKETEYGGLRNSGKYDYRKTLSQSKFKQEKYKPLIDTDFLISDRCCDMMKKSPLYGFVEHTGKKPILATMTTESQLREKNWLKFGCNAFNSKHPKSQPMSFWTEQDVLEYIRRYDLPIASVYGEVVHTADGCKLCTTGCDRTGCIFCGFGAHLSNDDRFLRLRETHPRQYEYCIGGGEYNKDGWWVPNKQGLGMGHVFDEINKIYGENFIRYK